jgi:hypothetical protein
MARSPNIKDDIAQHFAALAKFMCQCDVAQWQASSHCVDQTVALKERVEFSKAA